MNDEGEGAVVALLHRYALACDERDFDVLRGCFTPDATAEYSGVRLAPGVDHIVEHLQGLRRVPLTQHVVGTAVVEVAGDRARATSYTTVHLVRPAGEGHEVVHRGVRYDDELVRADAGWRIRERVHRVLWSTAQPTVWPVPPFNPG